MLSDTDRRIEEDLLEYLRIMLKAQEELASITIRRVANTKTRILESEQRLKNE